MTKSRLLVLLAVCASATFGADFTTYIRDQNQYSVAAITTDPAGSTYVTGSRDIPSVSSAPSTDVFVTKLDAAGKVVFTTTFGGKGADIGNAIAVDPSGNIWVGGATSSENFPLHDASQTALGSGFPEESGFLVELAPDGTVIYSSYFGGLLGGSSVNGIAIDLGGNLYLTGTTDASDFPATPGLPAGPGTVASDGITPVSGAFVTKLDATSLHVAYSALIVGTAVDCSCCKHLFPIGARHFGSWDCARCRGRGIDCGQLEHYESSGDSGELRRLWSFRRQDQCGWKPTGLFDLSGSVIGSCSSRKGLRKKLPRPPLPPTPRAMLT